MAQAHTPLWPKNTGHKSLFTAECMYPNVMDPFMCIDGLEVTTFFVFVFGAIIPSPVRISGYATKFHYHDYIAVKLYQRQRQSILVIETFSQII